MSRCYNPRDSARAMRMVVNTVLGVHAAVFLFLIWFAFQPA